MSAPRLIALGLVMVLMTLACRSAGEVRVPAEHAPPPMITDTQAPRVRIYLTPLVNDAVEFCVVVPSPWREGRTHCVLVRELRAWIVGRQLAHTLLIDK